MSVARSARLDRARPRSRAPLAAAVLCAALGAVGLAPSVAHAQDKPAAAKAPSSTSTLIGRAQDMFDDARYEESIQTLSAALVRPSTTPEDKVTVLKLLAYNYITINKTEEADAAVRALYVQDENFELPKTESPRFRDFFKKTKDAWVAEGKPNQTAVAKTAEKNIRIVHTSPSQAKAGTEVKLEGKIEDGGEVQKVELSVKEGGAKGKFVTRPLVFSMGAFRGAIPANQVKPPVVEYYLLALDKDGLPLASRGDADAPLRVVVPEERKSVLVSPWFWIPVGATVVAGAILTGVLVSKSGNDGQSTVKVTVRE